TRVRCAAGAAAQASPAARRTAATVFSTASLGLNHVAGVLSDAAPTVGLPPMTSAPWQLEPSDSATVRAMAADLAVDGVTAAVLVRRGFGDAGTARRFLDGAFPGHDPFALGDMRAAVEAIRAAVAGGARICVHGDYDADGICATALAVLLLRELEA